MSALHGLVEAVNGMQARRAYKAYLLEKMFVAAAVAAMPMKMEVAAADGPGALLYDMEVVKQEAGAALGLPRKATIKEIDIGLRHRGHGGLAKEVKQVHAGRCAVAHPSSDLHSRVATALGNPMKSSDDDHQQHRRFTITPLHGLVEEVSDHHNEQNLKEPEVVKKLEEKLGPREDELSEQHTHKLLAIFQDTLEDKVEMLIDKMVLKHMDQQQEQMQEKLEQDTAKYDELKSMLEKLEQQLQHMKLDMTKSNDKKLMQKLEQMKLDMTKSSEHQLQQMKMDMTKSNEQLQQTKLDMTKSNEQELQQAKLDMTKSIDQQMQTKLEQMKLDIKQKLQQMKLDMTKLGPEKLHMHHLMIIELDKQLADHKQQMQQELEQMKLVTKRQGIVPTPPPPPTR